MTATGPPNARVRVRPAKSRGRGRSGLTRELIMTVVHWARHGENAANLSRRFSYRVFDGDLTDRGIAQAEHLAEALRAAGRRYGLLVCSPLRRARQTAQIVSGRLRLPVEAELEDLREVNVCDLDGRNDHSPRQAYAPTPPPPPSRPPRHRLYSPD